MRSFWVHTSPVLRLAFILAFLSFCLAAHATPEGESDGEFISDPFEIERHLPCPTVLFEAALRGVIATHVYGDGPVTIATIYDIERRGNQRGVPYAIKDFKEQLVDFGLYRFVSPPIVRAVHNANQMDQPVRLVVCLLAEGCVMRRDRSVIYVQFAREEPEANGPVSEPDTSDQPPLLIVDEPGRRDGKDKKAGVPKKKVASKGEPKKKPMRKMVAHRKVKPSSTPPPEEIIGDVSFPRLLLIAEGGNDRFSEGIFAQALARSLVVFSEDVALENWRELNRLNNSSDEDELYRLVKSKRKEYEFLHRQIMVAVAEAEVRRYFLKDEVTKREEFEARNRAFQKYEALGISLDELVGETITPENIFELFEKLAAAYLHA